MRTDNAGEGLRAWVELGDPRLPARFWAKVELGKFGCWQWTASLVTDGYGVFSTDGKSWRAHRFAYVALVGPLTDDQVVDHLCRNRGCVNPQHLEPVANKENILRGVSPSALNARKTHCPRGHEMTSENVYLDPRGKRECRDCRQTHVACPRCNVTLNRTSLTRHIRRQHAEEVAA